MIVAPLPADETARLTALRAYDILDTLPEEEFDGITRLASTICGTPIALVSLIDTNRQWFKSSVGLDATETPRDFAFCAHAILDSKTMIVSDAHEDERFHDNPLVLAHPLVRFYAGAPLIVPTGERLGTLCVIDHQPRTLTSEQIAALEILARQVAAQLELRRKIAELEQVHAALENAEKDRHRSETQRALSDDRFRLLSDAAPIGIFETDVNGAVLYTNAAWQQIAGLTLAESLGKGWGGAVHPEDREVVSRAWKCAIDERRDPEVEFRFRSPEGSVSLVDARARAIISPSGEVYGYVGTVRDVTEEKLSTQAIAESEERYRDLFENATDMIQSVDPCGKFLYVNRAWLETLGYDASEVGQLVMFDVIDPGSVEQGRQMLKRVMAGERLPKVVTDFRTKSGERRTVEGTVSCRFENGRPVSTRGIFRDVTEQKKAEEEVLASESAMRSIIGSSLSGIVTFDQSGHIESINAAAEKILGYRRGEIEGNSIAILFATPPDDFEAFQRKAVDESIGRITEWEILRGDGRTIQIELALFEFQTARGKRLAGNIQDISQRRELERMKREFVSTVSHELRTPLTSIRGSLDLLEGNVFGALTPAASEAVSIAHRNTTRLIGLINDILDLDRLDSGKFEIELETTEVVSLFRGAIDSVRAFAQQSGVTIEAAVTTATVKVDSNRIIQVLINLLSNAVKFSEPGSIVRLSAVEQGDCVAIDVRDEGRGIPKQHLERIFDRFQQVEASDSRSKSGSGLGLAISRAIVEQHGGTIEVVSEEGKGSTFSIRLPGGNRRGKHAIESRVAGVLAAHPSASLEKMLQSEGSSIVRSDAIPNEGEQQ